MLAGGIGSAIELRGKAARFGMSEYARRVVPRHEPIVEQGMQSAGGRKAIFMRGTTEVHCAGQFRKPWEQFDLGFLRQIASRDSAHHGFNRYKSGHTAILRGSA